MCQSCNFTFETLHHLAAFSVFLAPTSNEWPIKLEASKAQPTELECITMHSLQLVTLHNCIIISRRIKLNVGHSRNACYNIYSSICMFDMFLLGTKTLKSVPIVENLSQPLPGKKRMSLFDEFEMQILFLFFSVCILSTPIYYPCFLLAQSLATQGSQKVLIKV